MTDNATDEERDRVFAELFLQPENKVCFDCNASNPKWASSNNAVLICFQCAGKHRTFGVQTSFVRSCALDKWKRKHLEQMKLGGNKAAKIYFERNDLIQAGQHNYKSPLAVKYRATLAKKAEENLKKEAISVVMEEPIVNEEIEVPAPTPEIVKEKKVVMVEANPIIQPAFAPIKIQKKEQVKQPKIKAKKLEIDFDSLGGEEPTGEDSPEVPKVKEIKTIKKPKPVIEKVEDDSDSKKYKKMPSVSSTDYMYSKNGNSNEDRDRISKFSNARGISSDDYYGLSKKPSESSNDNGFLDKAKEVGFSIFETAKEKMTDVIYNINQ